MAAQTGTMTRGREEFTSPEAIRATFAEFIATMFFVFIGVGSIASFIEAELGGIVIIALAHGLAYALLVAAIGPISGGHINPAVTFATVITNRIAVTRGAMYIVAQLLGAVVGALLLKALLSGQLLDRIPGAGGNGFSEGGPVRSSLAGLGIEALMTGLLVWTVFATAVFPKGNTVIAPLVIGFAVLVIHLVAVPLTGAGANPARTFGPQIVGVGGGNDIGVWNHWWIYYLGPLLGGGIAGLVCYVLYLMEDERAAGAGAGP